MPNISPFSARRIRLLGAFLWISVISWGIGLGAKLFDLLVLATAWGAAPPESLSLMPYGKLYPVDPGNFFQPLSALLLVGAVGSLAAGWQAPWPYRIWLLVPLLMLVTIWILTPMVFWPMINDLWAVHKGRLSLGSSQVNTLVHHWFAWDSLRSVLIAAGFVSSLHAMSSGSRHGV